MTGAFSLEAAGMSKRFGALAALDDVSLRVEAGSVHALLGENGAGKSTLVKCIMGFYHADEGSLLLDGHEIEVRNPRDAARAGLGMVYQHFTLVPSMTVLENLVMARADTPEVIDWTRERERLSAFIAGMPFAAPLDTPAHGLAAGEKQKAEILKQLYLGARFLILDEPTSVLTPQEADQMLGTIRDMARARRLTALLITHKFREVLAYADAATVLRKGRLAGTGRVADLAVDRMAAMMIGEERPAAPVARGDAAPGAVRLAVEDLRADDADGVEAVRGVTLAVRAGEIVGIAGVSGNGQSHMLVEGELYGARRAETQRHHLALLPEEPLRNACVGRMSVAENMAIRSFDRPPMANGFWLSGGAMRAAARDLIKRYRVKTPGPDAPIGSLSGGNVQRAVLARELGGEVHILVAANPVFGLDFAAVADIHSQIVAARNRGAAVLLVSEDLDELLDLSDRLLVMSEGRIVLEMTAAAADRTAIGRAMAGH